MSGWIETLPSGRLRAVYRDAAGDRHSELFDNRKAAKAFLAAAAADMARGQWVDPRGGQILFREWQERWFASRLMRRATARAYATTLRAHLVPQFGHLQLMQITPLGVRSFVTTLAEKRRPKTVRNAHALLSNVMRDAVLEGLILTNPCLGIRLPQDSAYEAVFLSPGQIDRLVVAVPEHYRSLVQLAAGTGMRWGELTGLKRQRLDLLRRRLEVVETLEDIDGVLTFGQPKSARSRRTISLPPHLVEVMARHLEGHQHELVFVSEQGTPVRRSNFYSRIWLPATRAAGLVPHPRFHDLRHSHVALLIAENVPMKAIQVRLGHASIVMTMDRYGHLLDDVDDQGPRCHRAAPRVVDASPSASGCETRSANAASR